MHTTAQAAICDLTNLVRVDDEVGLHVLLLHFACLYKISHAGGVPATPLPQHCVQRAQQSPDVVLHNTQTVLMHLSEHQLLAVVMNQDMLGMLSMLDPGLGYAGYARSGYAGYAGSGYLGYAEYAGSGFRVCWVC